MKTKLMITVGVLCALLLLANSALAMSSTNYKLDWFVPLTGSGGNEMSSTNYKAYVTIGQTAIGTSTSTNYRVGLGYWYGLLSGRRLHLPLILR
jgi:hypothetical protein